MNRSLLIERAAGSILGLAIGDALGMPTQSLSREQIALQYGTVDGLLSSNGQQPIAPSMPAGTVTDDTEQALLLGHLLVQGGGRIDPDHFANALADWEREMEAKGSLDLLGPSTKAAIAAIQAGAGPDDDPGRFGTTNGAAMRIAPVGIAFRPERLQNAVIEASRLTHNTGLGLSSAGAVAAAISHALEFESVSASTIIEVAAAAADEFAAAGNWVAGGAIGPRIRWATKVVEGLDETDALDFISDVVGTSVASQESIPAAFALVARFGEEPFVALQHAAALGGDTDTVAAMAGAILGAWRGTSVWPDAVAATVNQVNTLDLGPLVSGLIDLRQAQA